MICGMEGGGEGYWRNHFKCSIAETGNIASNMFYSNEIFFLWYNNTKSSQQYLKCLSDSRHQTDKLNTTRNNLLAWFYRNLLKTYYFFIIHSLLPILILFFYSKILKNKRLQKQYTNFNNNPLIQLNKDLPKLFVNKNLSSKLVVQNVTWSKSENGSCIQWPLTLVSLKVKMAMCSMTIDVN